MTDAASFIFSLLIVSLFLIVAIYIAGIPGRIARGRNHPNADAITACGYIGLILGITWIVGLIWALSVPSVNNYSQKSSYRPRIDPTKQRDCDL